MYKLDIETKTGRLEFNGNEPYQIVEMQGLNPPEAVINTFTKSIVDGEFVSSTKLKSRIIELAFVITYNAEEHRRNLYKVLSVRSPLRLYYKNSFRNVYIDGILQNFNVDYFNRTQVITLTIFCGNPYFVDIKEIETPISNSTAGFTFPFKNGLNTLIFSTRKERNAVIENETGQEVGFIAKFLFKDSVQNVELHEESANLSMYIRGNFRKGDEIELSTVKGDKYCHLLSGGRRVSILDSVSATDWLYISTGRNVFTYLIDNSSSAYDKCNILIKYKKYYEGV